MLEPYHAGCFCALLRCSLGCKRSADRMSPNFRDSIKLACGVSSGSPTLKSIYLSTQIPKVSNPRRPAKHASPVPDCCAKPFAILVVGGVVGKCWTAQTSWVSRVAPTWPSFAFCCPFPATGRRRFTLDADATRQCVCAFQARLYFFKKGRKA